MERKTIANCSMVEFLQQGNKIRKKVALFYKEIIKPLRESKPPISAEEFKAEKDPVKKAEMKKVIDDFAAANLEKMFDSALETNAELTLETLALCCFEDVDAFKNECAFDVFGTFLEIFSSKRCIDFFTTLMQLKTSVDTSEKQTSKN